MLMNEHVVAFWRFQWQAARGRGLAWNSVVLETTLMMEIHGPEWMPYS